MIRVHPVDDRQMVDRKHAPDAAEVHPYQGRGALLRGVSLCGVAERLRLGRIDALALAAVMPLAAVRV